MSVRKKVMAVVYVDKTRCTGCGLCVDVCPTGAISVVNSVARVEQNLCRECESCLSACPAGAILPVREPASAAKPAPVRVPAPASVPIRDVVPASQSGGGVWPWLGAALGFVGREVVPRMAVLFENLSQRSRGEGVPTYATTVPGPRSYDARGRGRRARRRRRGHW